MIGAQLMAQPGKTVGELTLALYGLAFKPDVDDLRESPALGIARTLVSEHKGPVLGVEPNVRELPPGLSTARLVNQDKADRADVHVLLVDNKQFKVQAPSQGQIVDTRGIWT